MHATAIGFYIKSLTDVTFSRLFRWPIVPIVRTADVECYRFIIIIIHRLNAHRSPMSHRFGIQVLYSGVLIGLILHGWPIVELDRCYI